MVRHQFGASERPGQRARRILENQAPNWEEDKTGDVLSEVDLKIVEDGVTGMRGWTHAEERLVEASRAARARRRRNRQIRTGIGIAAIVLIMAGLITSLVFSGMAKRAQSVAIEAKDEAIEAKDEAITERDRAQRAEAVAEDQRDRAQREARRAIAGQIAAAARSAENSDQKLLLASEAVRRTYPVDQYVTPQAEEILLDALADAPPHLLSFPSHRHRERITSIAFSPDGMWIATASRDGYITLWNTITDESKVLVGHTDDISTVAFSQDSMRIVTASKDRTARIWDVYGNKVHELMGHTQAVNSAAFSTDGRRVVTASNDKTVRLWDVGSGQELKTVACFEDVITSAAFDPAGDNHMVIVTGCGVRKETTCVEGFAQMLDVTNQDKGTLIKDESGGITSAAFSPDGEWILTANEQEIAQLWKRNGLPANQSKATPARSHRQASVRCGLITRLLSPSVVPTLKASARTARRSYGIVPRGRRRGLLSGSHNDVTVATFSPDGTMVALGDRRGLVRLLDAATGQEVRTLGGHSGDITWATFSPRCDEQGDEVGKRSDTVVTAGKDRTVRLWNAATGANLRGFSPVRPSKLPQLRLIVAVDSLSQAANSKTSGSVVFRLRFFCGTRRPETGPLCRFSGLETEISAVAFNPKGDAFVATGCAKWNDANQCIKGTGTMWDLVTGTPHQFGNHTAAITAAAFEPSGERFATASDDKTVRTWSMSTLKELQLWPDPLLTTTTAVAFDRQGRMLAVGDTAGVVHILDAKTLAGKNRLEASEDTTPEDRRGIRSVSFSPDGSAIVAASNDSARVLNPTVTTEPEQQITAFRHKTDVYSAFFSEDGKRILTADTKAAHIWDAASSHQSSPCTESEQEEIRGATGTHYIASVFKAKAEGYLCGIFNEQRVRLKGDLKEMTAAAVCVIPATGQPMVVIGKRDGTLQLYEGASGVLRFEHKEHDDKRRRSQ